MNMRTKNFLKHLILGVLILITGNGIGQVTTGGNVANATSDFLGWDATSLANDFPLNVKHEGNFPIIWWTDNIERMILNQTTSYNIGSVTFGAQVKDGALGLSPNNSLWSTGPGGPFSRLHLHDGNGLLTAGYRPWMDNGVTFTTNQDHMYVGHKVEDGGDQTAAVIQWADNELSPAGPDVMKFIFTSNFNRRFRTNLR